MRQWKETGLGDFRFAPSLLPPFSLTLRRVLSDARKIALLGGRRKCGGGRQRKKVVERNIFTLRPSREFTREHKAEREDGGGDAS